MAKNPTLGEVVLYPAKGGLETISIPGTTTVGRLIDGTNFVVDITGYKKKHPGVVRQDDQSTALAPLGEAKGLFDYWKLTGTAKTRRTILVASGKVYADNGDGTYVDVTSSFTITPEANVCIETFFGLAILSFTTNPSSQILKYNQGSAIAALGGSPPNGKYLRRWLSRLWVAGIDTAPDRVRGSVIDDPEDWTSGNGSATINLDTGDQDPVGVTGLMPPLFGRMAVGKRRSIYEITPASSSFSTRIISDGVGLISHNSAVATSNDILFASEQGIHSLGMTDKYGEVESTYLSFPIQDYWQENIRFEKAENMRAIYSRELGAYLLSATTVGSNNNNVVLGYSLTQQEWFKFDENVSAFCEYVDPDDNYKTKILVCDDTGRVGILDTKKRSRTVTWFGERRTMELRSGPIYPLGPYQDVTFRRLRIFFKPQTSTNSKIDVRYLVNGAFVDDLEFPQEPQDSSLIGSSQIGTAYIGGRGTVKQVTRELKGVGSSIELILSHTPAADNDDCEIYGLVIEYEYTGEGYQPRSQ